MRCPRCDKEFKPAPRQRLCGACERAVARICQEIEDEERRRAQRTPLERVGKDYRLGNI